MARKKKADPKEKSVEVSKTKGTGKSLDWARDALKKMGMGEHIVEMDGDRVKEPRPHITTGSIILDRQIGGPKNQHGIVVCPGWLKGGIINLYGHESSGKTTLALTTAAAVNRAGGTVAFLDWEYAIALDYADKIGVDADKFMLFQPNTLEQGIKFLILMTSDNPEYAVDLIILDSVSAGLPEAMVSEEEVAESKRKGLVAAKWSETLPRLKGRLAQHGTTLIGISQLRASNFMGGGPKSGPKTQAAGGNVWKFMSDVRMKLRRVGKKTEKVLDPITNKVVEQPYGSVIRSTLEKCKVSGAMWSEAEFIIRQGYGIDNVASAIDIMTSRGLIEKNSSWYSFALPNGTEFKAQGSEKLRSDLLENEEAMAYVLNTAQELLYGG